MDLSNGLDLLKKGYELVSGDDKKPSSSGGMLDKILALTGINSAEKKEAQEAKEQAKEERANIFAEVGKSIMLRKFPSAMAYWDVIGGVAGVANRFTDQVPKIKSANAFPGQDIFDGLTGMLRIIPQSWKKFITEPIGNSSIFQLMIQYWPAMGDDIRERVKKNEPDGVVDAFRVISQDLASGKVSAEKITSLMGK